MRFVRVVLVVGCCIGFARGAYSDTIPSGTWKAGVAQVVITPTSSLWMDGYAVRDRPAEGALHDLWAKALALEDAEGNRAVMVTTDLVGIKKAMSDRIRKRLAERYGLSRAQIILNSSHTHSGPVLMSDYVSDFSPEDTCKVIHIYPLDRLQISMIRQYSQQFEDRILDLVGSALASLTPARVFAGVGVTRFQVNRRNNAEARIAFQSDLNGPNDFSVPVLKVENTSGRLMAVAFGYACHNAVLDGYEWSGDYAGFAQLALNKTYPEATALFFQGAGGDQNPIPRRSVALARQYGLELAAAVETVLSGEMTALDPKLSTAYSEIDLEYASPLPGREMLVRIREGKSDYPEYRRFSAALLLERMKNEEALSDRYPYPVQLWRLGNQLIFSLGGEVVVEYAIRIKQIYGYESFVLGYSNDVMGYIPSARVLLEGGYEAARTPIFTTAWHPNTESKIIAEVIRLSDTMGIQAGNSKN